MYDDDSAPFVIPLVEGGVYLTPEGAAALEKELSQLRYRDRPQVTKTVAWAAGNGDRSENGDYIYGKKKLREIDKRMEFINKRLDKAVVIDPAKHVARDEQRVAFGARVTILFEDGREASYHIVGVDEVDVSVGKISWRSPLGRTLLRGQVGDALEFHSPRGEQEIEILSVSYEHCFSPQEECAES